ncbi:MAG TPA: histidine kinase [Gemmatimonadaceae bacterium]|nr:histidine kinase [Gemmatimonadaceae bacterium]
MTAAVAENRSAKGNVGHQLVDRILGVPLVDKIIGANAIIIAVGFGFEAITSRPGERTGVMALAVIMVVASIVNVLLIRLALRPVKDLVGLAERVSGGDFNARGTPSPFADEELSALGSTINSLLDSLALERKRIRDLGVEVIYAQDAERSRVARELHDSIAQNLAAAKFQIAAAGAGASEEIRNHLAAVNEMLTAITEEVRDVSNSLHPRVAEDLGLESALTTLARQIKERSGVNVAVSVCVSDDPIPMNVSSTIYRVAEEALNNIEMHSRATHASVDVISGNGLIRVEVADDGTGFDPNRMNRAVGRSGLASVKDRVVLAGGKMEIDSKPNGGTRVMAEIQTSGDTK